jgi:hypothetical protein
VTLGPLPAINSNVTAIEAKTISAASFVSLFMAALELFSLSASEKRPIFKALLYEQETH